MVTRPKRKPQPQPPELITEEPDDDPEEDEPKYDDEGPLWDPEEAGR